MIHSDQEEIGEDLGDEVEEQTADPAAALREALADLSPHARDEATRIRTAVLAAIDELTRAEQLEVNPSEFDALVDELVLAGLQAKNPRHALKKLRLTLIHSDRVEEVYADDTTLEDAFRRSLGG